MAHRLSAIAMTHKRSFTLSFSLPETCRPFV
jgi:hypothetical protein